MSKKLCFLKWWLLNIVVFICFIICAKVGVITAIYEKDASFLCFVIMFIYILCSAFNGFVADDLDKNKTSSTEKNLEYGWFFSEFCLSLGMIGTVVGFIMMLADFANADVNNLQKLIGSMSYGMSTALYTTLCGLIFGNLLKLQCFDMQKTLEKKNDET